MNKTILDEKRAATSPSKLDGKKIVGMVIPYNRPADLGYGCSEVIAPGAVAELLRSTPKIAAILEHTGQLLLGCTIDGTLKLTDTAEGLMYEITPAETSYANDLRSAMAANPSTYGASWHMIVPADGYDVQCGDDSTYLRTITRIKEMREITITAFPVYVDTTAMLRSAKEPRQERSQEAAGIVEYLEIMKQTL